MIKTCTLGLLLLAFLASAPSSADETWRGVDLSYVNELEDCGARYRVHGELGDPFGVLADKGANLVRLRLWHTPDWTN